MNDDTYEKARDPLKRYIARCPVCGSDAGLWKRKLGNVTVAVRSKALMADMLLRTFGCIDAPI